MNLILFIGAAIAVIAIVLVFLLHSTYTNKFIKYIPALILIVAGVVLIPASLFTSSWTGTGVGLLGLMAIILGVVVLLIAVIMDTAKG
ncbi:hypothetical protein CFK37_02840 [Virgibacillus phasianinus]|uniref:YesK-like protein n=1 Tax=Virgibacillus phasianinus TaxID=2017483 RepID=A0A220U010_9BACI|nr:hypothetical protein [Virgibacillus phasianinus]ASK61203.1 hypothetical protein CFK37_02840 [Virgibacillus phasianinus]